MSDQLHNGSNTVELIPNGGDILVTDLNKDDFIRKKSYFIGYLSVQDQLDSLVEGFNKVIPQSWVKVFTSDEIEAAICGKSHIDLDDWKANTETKGYGKWSQSVRRFWQAMETYNQAELANILQFCTGTSRLPLGGFRSLESNRGEKAKFCI